MSRAIIAISYEKLLQLAEQCRITRNGSKWIDAQKLIDEVGRVTVRVRATTPNSLTEIIAYGQKRLTRGERYAHNLEDLAAMLGVSRQTLDSWRGNEVIELKKIRLPDKKLYYDLSEIVKSLQFENDKQRITH